MSYTPALQAAVDRDYAEFRTQRALAYLAPLKWGTPIVIRQSVSSTATGIIADSEHEVEVTFQVVSVKGNVSVQDAGGQSFYVSPERVVVPAEVV